jgi:osmotically inducible protein OsmC
MALSAELTRGGYKPTRIATTANVHIERVEGGGFEIPLIELTTEAEIPGIDDAAFQGYAEGAKVGCPVSKALAGPTITLNATLV